MIKKRANEHVSHDGLTRTSSTGNEKMRHLCEIANHYLTGNILTNSKGKLLFSSHLAPLISAKKLMKTNASWRNIWNLNTNHVRTRNWRFDTNLICSKRHSEVLVILKKLVDADASRWTKRILRNAWTEVCAFNRDINIKLR